MQLAILALGCFWNPEEKLRKIKGITSTEVGYCGGSNPNVTYEEVTKLFFKFHDPTTLNRQGSNVGYQYRSEIFYNTDEEKLIAEKILKEVNKKLNGKVVTKISEEKNYCKAEEYHQKYFQKKSLK